MGGVAGKLPWPIFLWGEKSQGEGGLTRKRDGGRLERKKRVKGKERGRENRCTSSKRVE